MARNFPSTSTYQEDVQYLGERLPVHQVNDSNSDSDKEVELIGISKSSDAPFMFKPRNVPVEERISFTPRRRLKITTKLGKDKERARSTQDVLLGIKPKHFGSYITSNISQRFNTSLQNKSIRKKSLLNAKMEYKLTSGTPRRGLRRTDSNVDQWFRPEDRECYARALIQQSILIKRNKYFDTKRNRGLNQIKSPFFNCSNQDDKYTGALSKFQLPMTEVNKKAMTIEAKRNSCSSSGSGQTPTRFKEKPEVITLDEEESDISVVFKSDAKLKNEEVEVIKILERPQRKSEEDDDILEIIEKYSSQSATKVEDLKKKSVVPKFNSFEAELSCKDVCNQDYVKLLREKYDSKAREFERQVRLEQIKKDHASEISRKNEALVEDRLRRTLKITEVAIEEEEEAAELPEITDDMKEKIIRALNSRGETLIEKFNIPICRKDVETLRGLNWLNDEIINFYMQMIVDRSKNTDNWPKVYAFTTFFYPKLMQSGHAAVRRWTRKVDIFSHDILIIPVHLGMHWCLGVVDFRKPGVYYYDSMLGNNPGFLRAAIKYLEDEHLDKKKSPFITSEFKKEIVKNIPQQMNGSDCGMFTCKFAEYLSRDSDVTFTQEDMPYFRDRMIYEICSGILLHP